MSLTYNTRRMTHEITERQVKNLIAKLTEIVTSKKKLESIMSKYFPEEKGSKSPEKIKSSGSLGYKIVYVSGSHEYPSSKYKKDQPIEAAESALKAILRKSGLKKDSADLTFTIQEGDGPKYSYSFKDQVLKRTKEV